MKLTIKSLKQVPYELEVQSDEIAILDLKKEFEKAHGFDHTTLKLVFAGAVLDDSKTLAQCNIKDGSVIVMMSAKAKPINTQKEEAKVEEKPVQQTTTVKQEQPVQQTQPKKEKDYTEEIKNLMDMGFPKNEAEGAIKAARGDVNLAIEFLYNGIPENLPVGDDVEMSPASALKSLASLVKVLCYNNPSQLQNILLTLQQNSPESFELIRQNEDEFKNLLQQPINEEDMRAFQQFQQQGDLMGGQGQSQGHGQVGGNSGSGQRRDVIKLSKEDYEAVGRLKEMGFSEMDAVQAFFACDKNEDMAANLLFDNKLRDQENEIYIDCNIF
jgi:UV excision repair protein RAD23